MKRWKDKQLSIYAKIDEDQTKASNAALKNEYDEAITTAESVIKLAREIKNYTIIEKQEEFIEKMHRKKEENSARNEAIEKVKILASDLEHRLKSNDTEGAYAISSQIKALYTDLINKKPPDSHQKLISEAEDLHRKWRVEQERKRQKQVEISEKTTRIKKKIDAYLEENEPNEIPDLLEKLRITLAESTDEQLKAETKEYITEIEAILKELRRKALLGQELESLLADAKAKTTERKFGEAIEITKQAIDLATEKDLKFYQDKAQEAEERIKGEKASFEKQLALLERIKNHVEEYASEKKYKAAIMNCEKGIKLAAEVGKPDLAAEYQRKRDDLQSQYDDYIKKAEEQRQKLLDTAKELEEIIEVEEDVLPQMDEFSVQDLLGDLSSDIDEMTEQLGGLLNAHRVEIKEEITSSSLIRSVSGEVMEISKSTQVEDISDQNLEADGSKTVKFSVDSVLENPFDEMIEEAVIQDIIPYNFEINEVTLNGELPDQEPEHLLTKEGLELKWKINDVPPKESVAINYDLRKRVSRTIIFPMEDQIKIVKTHSSLQPLDPMGLFDANLKFANKFNKEIQGVVIEDIVPVLYIYQIKSPDEDPMDKTEEPLGELVKWRINNVPVDYSNIYRYQLLEIYRFEDLKIKAHSFSENAFTILEQGDIDKALMEYAKIQHLLKDYE